MVAIRALIYCCVISCLILPACSSETKDPATYSEADDTIKTTVGERFEVVLESNPTTGYSWQFGQPIDSILIKLVEKKYLAKPNPDKLMGRGGHDHWWFEPVAAGTTVISLEYLRPWDSTSVEKMLDFTVEIEQK